MHSSLDELAATQQAYFAAGHTRAVEGRRAALRRLATALEDRSEDALAALAEDLGKPALEAWLAEVHFIRSEIDLLVRHLPRWARPRRCRSPFYFLPARSEVRREPQGRVLIAAPWNYPLQLALSPLISAIGAGNCVTLKPSEQAPASSRFLASLLGEVFEEGHVAVVEGGAETGAALLDQPFAHYFYTGGEAVGRRYAEAAARHLSPVTLELGGKCPCVVDDDCDLDLAVERIVSTKLFNAGQTCVAPDFVIVPSAKREEFVQRAAAEIERNYGSGVSPDLARIVNDRHYERLLSLLSEETIRIGTDDRDSRYLAPRLLPDADWEDAAMQEEIFGPILPVLAWDDLEALLGRLAALPEPLALYAFSRNGLFLEQIAHRVRSGALCFNDAMKTATNPHLPLGGVGRSGIGRYRGEAGFANFSYERSVVRRWQVKDVFLVKPPYGNQLTRLRKFLRG